MQIIAHRGASATHPENTLAAFEAAIDAGADGIELDVHLSADGVPVVVHDFTVGGVPVRALTARELAAQATGGSAGAKGGAVATIPPLRAVLELLGRLVPATPQREGGAAPFLLNVELKAGSRLYPGIEAATTELVREVLGGHGAIAIAYSSFDHPAMAEIRRVDPDASIAVLHVADLIDLSAYAQRLGAAALHPPGEVVTPEYVASAHAAGLAVRVWTVNDPARAAALARLGIDAVMTDDPAALRAAMAV